MEIKNTLTKAQSAEVSEYLTNVGVSQKIIDSFKYDYEQALLEKRIWDLEHEAIKNRVFGQYSEPTKRHWFFG